ncbi:G-protein coupled receptor 35 [Callorhinchus milii]|uniref:G-protein coupled receptor 35-like n=1 Tax=Callorhinchus milii TaxID=7868 RepID=V9L5Y0_CALMI|nr:G-protein coupled receptor 35 [Callorhinchus milii]|eukprot:gi/632934647/ref/XP_007885806.1/ PREDICTED: G-protein coupled receptor 35-like [Callorhinchus milii]
MICNSTNYAELFQYIIYIPTFIFGLLFNMIALWVICCKLQKWTETTIYMTNLAVSDSLLLISLPFKMHSIRCPQAFDLKTCSFLTALYTINTYVSIYIVACISLDRYIAISHPFRATTLRSTMKAVIICGTIWILVVLCCGLTFALEDSVDNNGTLNNPKCFRRSDDVHEEIYVFVFIETIGFIIPLTIVTFCSFRIIRTLQQRKRWNPRTAVTERTIRVVTANLITFIICFTPVHVGMFVKFMKGTTNMNINLLFQFCVCIAATNCCFDGMFYYFATAEIRELYNNGNNIQTSWNVYNTD